MGHRITLTIPESVWRDILRRAEAEGISGAAWIRRAVLIQLQVEKQNNNSEVH
jgi:hypothetical protein